MKKRIISLVLVIVMAAGLLVSCGYSFANDDMSKYATFDKAAFDEWLKNIEIEDGDFTTDEAVREKKVNDAIFATLKSAAVDKYDGIPALYDIIYYCYYATYLDDEGKVVTLYSNMGGEKVASETQISSFADPDSFGYKLYEAVKSYVFKGAITEGDTTNYGTNYHTTTSGVKAKDGDKVAISYTVEFTPAGEDKAVNYTFKNKMVTISSQDAFLAKLIDAEAGKSVTFGEENSVKITEGEIEYTYSAVKLEWIINAGSDMDYTFKHTPYPETEKLVDVYHEVTGLASGVDIKGKELTYHIFPVYFKDVPNDLTWKLIVEEIFGTSITSSAFDAFSKKDDSGNETLKNEDGVTLAELIDGNKEKDEEDALYKSLATLLKEKDTAEKEYNDAAEDKKADAETEKKNAEKAYTDRLNLIEGIINANSLADVIVKEHKDNKYDELEDAYNNEIKANLAKKLKEYLDKNVVVGDTLPEEAVEDVYYIMMQNHKYTFYQGNATEIKNDKEVEIKDKDGNNISWYKYHNGSFDAYLIAAINTKENTKYEKVDEAEAKVMECARDFVAELVKIYAVSAAYDCLISDEEYEERAYDDFYYSYFVAYYGDIGYRAAAQFADLYNKLLIIEGEQEAIDAYEAAYEAYNDLSKSEKEETEAPEYDFDFDYKEGKIPFVSIKYTIKAED